VKEAIKRAKDEEQGCLRLESARDTGTWSVGHPAVTSGECPHNIQINCEKGGSQRRAVVVPPRRVGLCRLSVVCVVSNERVSSRVRLPSK
jgi:hypothetical protein